MRTNTRVAQIEVESEVVERALREYEREDISLGRLAEILGVDRLVAGKLVEARGMQIRFAPATIEEALEDARVAQTLSDS